jgi:transglutaminase/protease-like cytokinesis protein 3
MAIFAQSANDYSSVDEVMLRIPKSSTFSTTDMADYINHNFKKQADKARAIYFWITTNIQYDIRQKSVVYYNDDYTELMENVLTKKKGICMHYALLFNEIAQKTGIKSYVVFGYTKQDGKVDIVPHAWCAAQIDSSWFLFDPTWGAGYVQKGTFIRKLNNEYFKMNPQNSIKSHMPFDPLWQLSDYPITNQEFYSENLLENKNRPYFNYRDSLALYEQSSELEKAISSARRIKRNGVVNSLISNRLQNIYDKIEYYEYEKTMTTLSTAVKYYNSSIENLNNVIENLNNKQGLATNSKELSNMLDLAADSLIISEEKIKEISTANAQAKKSIQNLQESIKDVRNKIQQQRYYLQKMDIGNSMN